MTDAAKIKFSLAQLVATVAATFTIAGFWVRFEVRMNTWELKQVESEKSQVAVEVKISNLQDSDKEQDKSLAIIKEQMIPLIEPSKIRGTINISGK